MLQELNGVIQEKPPSSTGWVTTTADNTTGGVNVFGQTVGWDNWHNYPIYVYLDKTRKAIDILKALEADKTLKVTSVSRFIALVEKISGLL